MSGKTENRPYLIVTRLWKLSVHHPAQWAGLGWYGGDDPLAVYVRYRWGGLQVGIGPTLDDAVDNEFIVKEIGHDMDGVLSFEALCQAIPEVQWPDEETADDESHHRPSPPDAPSVTTAVLT